MQLLNALLALTALCSAMSVADAGHVVTQDDVSSLLFGHEWLFLFIVLALALPRFISGRASPPAFNSTA